LTCKNDFTIQTNVKYRVGGLWDTFVQQLKSNGHSTLWTGSLRTDSVKESNFPHLLDGGGGRGGTSWTKRGFKRVYDFSVEPSHSVSQWTRAHCDNRPHCVRFRLGSKTERFGQGDRPKQRCVHLKDFHCQKRTGHAQKSEIVAGNN